MTNDFLPNMRGLVSHDLHEAGVSQRRIAVLLGITQARVSYYLSKRKAYFAADLGNKFSISQNDMLSYSRILAEDVQRSQLDGIFTLYSIWKNLLFTGAICSAHQRESNIQSDCSVCMELHKPARESISPKDEETEDTQILREISEAVALIEASSQFPYLMPEVSVNIAMSRKTPKSSRDIAAIPGRLNRIHGRAKAFVLPEFGSSKHMSRVLLIFHTKNRSLRAVLNLKFDTLVEKTLEELSVPRCYTTVQTFRPGRQMRVETPQDALMQRLESTTLADIGTSRVVAVLDRGSEGVEPITYLLGSSASEIAQLAIRMSKAYVLSESSRS